MDHHQHTSYQKPKGQSIALPSGAEEFVSFKCDDEILVSTRGGKSGVSSAVGRLKIPMIVALSLWLVVITVELSPFLLIVGDKEQSSLRGSFQDDDDDGDDNVQKDDDDDSFEVLLGSASFAEIVFGIRPCSMEECASSPCDNTEHTRFPCLSLRHNAKIRGGCGATPWTDEICADQCDASGCARLLQKPITAATWNASNSNNSNNKVDHCNVKCPKQWCERRRLCGTETTSYQCMVGVSIYGCSADKYEWTVRSNESDCSACCNTTSCS